MGDDGTAADGVGAVPSIWRGHRVSLRPVEPTDWPFFAEWGGDDAVSRAAAEVPFPESREAVKRWTEEQATREPRDDRFRWLIVGGDGTPVGTINSHSCDRRVGSFSYGVALSARWQGRGYAAEAIRLVIRYYFAELGYQKVNVHVYEFNDGSRRLHEALGFVQEGRLRRMHFTEGRHWDTFVYGLTREEFAVAQAAKLPVFSPLGGACGGPEAGAGAGAGGEGGSEQ